MGHTVEYVCKKDCGWANATHYEDLDQENEQGPQTCPKCGGEVKHLGARHDGNRNQLIQKEIATEPAEKPVAAASVRAPDVPKKKAPRKVRAKTVRKH